MRTLLFLLLTLATGRSQLLIYQTRATAQSSGDGASLTIPLKGFMIVVPSSNHVAQLVYDTLPYSSRYDVDRGEVVMAKVSGKNGKQSTVFVTAGKSGTRYLQMHYVGVDASLKDNAQTTATFPRSFKGTHHSLNTAHPAIMSDTSITATYSEKRTIAANASGKSIDEVLAQLQAEVELQGIYPFGSRNGSSASSVTLTAPPAPAAPAALSEPVVTPPEPAP